MTRYLNDDETAEKRRTLAFSLSGTAFLRTGCQHEKWGDQPDPADGPGCEVSLTPDADEYVWQVTACGVVKCTDVSAFRSATRKAGIRGLDLDQADRLAAVFVLAERARNADVVIMTAGGIAIRFNADEVRPLGRLARGVRGISLAEGVAGESVDVVATAFPIELNHNDCLVGVLTTNGYAFRFPASDLPLHGRGTPGVIARRISTATGSVTFATTMLADGRSVGQPVHERWARIPWQSVPVRPRRTGNWTKI